MRGARSFSPGRWAWPRNSWPKGWELLAAGELARARDAWQQALAILEDLQHPDADQVRAKLAA
jgi:hypothetical protein